MSTAARPENLAPLLEEATQIWQDILPGVDGSAIEVIGRLEVIARWLADFKAKALAPFQLNFAEWTTLTVLRVSGDDCRRSPTELRRRVGQTSAGMTRILTKLERAELVGREPLAKDGRRSDVVLTARGRDVAEESFQCLQTAQSELLDSFGKAEREQLKGALDRLLAAFASADGDASDQTVETMRSNAERN